MNTAPPLTDEEVQQIVLGIDVPLHSEATDSLKQTLASLPMEEQVPPLKRSFSHEITRPMLVTFLLGLGLGLLLMAPWNLSVKKKFEKSVVQLSDHVQTLMNQLKQYEDPPHPTTQEIIQPLQPNETIKRTT
ncbi:MAG: hypothetical protein JSS62_05865 [Verrucomicrobia bacterium]|nr:hypothetical protein [Verrucomicrobiota bacterium]MBS0647124.1 hypothetical protein [Verrucomicrobiota bacterium]